MPRIHPDAETRTRLDELRDSAPDDPTTTNKPLIAPFNNSHRDAWHCFVASCYPSNRGEVRR